ncbi:putative baseplate assembly protein [Halotia branconii]|uniref:Baseplate assembly protein n=1 Tax=Halotia branconii CENA392 TaxID=1539056 RepID=A0AAJ6PBJ6_9CYAN|nr:putative baseplate assembly protein [Halotia branconii]WGV28004.1 putative baseplate assembly protein [Halotia branconii CENA392]
MTLPSPRLDDKTFAQLMEDARKLIPRYAPEWTDHNTHDPGITFLELFAWLTELQRYYLDQVRDENYLKFLKLVGIRLKDIVSATTDVKFSFIDRGELVPILIPQGTKLTTNEQVIFETDTSLLIVPDSLQKVISSCKSGRQDNREASNRQGLSFFAFGENAEVGSCLYLGFKLYVFDWDNIFSVGFNIDSERLKQFLEIYLGFNWVRNIDNEAIYKNDDGTQIILIYGEQRLTLELDEINNQVKLTFNEAVIDEICLIVVNEDNRRRIYGQPFPIDKSIALTFNLFEGYPVKRGKYKEEFVKIIPSATLAWEYWGSDRLWKKLDVNCDETLNLSQSGRLWFTVPQDLSVRNLFPFTEQLFWLRAVVKEAGYELPPKINNILLNTISVTEKNTLSEVTIHSSHYQTIQSFPASYLALIGENVIQVKQFTLTLTLLFFNSRLKLLQPIFWLAVVLCYEFEMQHGYWKDWQNYRLEKNQITGTITVTFRRKVPPKGKNNIRLISYLEQFDEQRFLGKSNGLPSQSFSLKHFAIVSESFKIQLKQQIENDYLWKDWIQVKDFDASSPEDPHYVLDAENGKIYFGDGINGDIPPVLDDDYSICIVSCQTSDGEKGNVEAKTINQIFDPVSTLVNTEFICPTKLTVENQRATSGGAPLETLEKAKLRARKSLKQINKAVTSEDFELLALSTPGLRIARVKAIAPPATEAKNLVKVVVIPYSETPIPAKPSSGFLQNVYQHLEPHRLITTKLEVIPPSYVEVKVKALLRVRSGFNPDEVCQQVNQSLIERFLHPLHGGFNGKGWQFGRAVYKSEVYKAIEDFNKGVDCVKTLDLSFQNTDQDTNVTLDKQGNIHISVHTLIYSNKHEIYYENQ